MCITFIGKYDLSNKLVYSINTGCYKQIKYNTIGLLSISMVHEVIMKIT